ncbi:LysR substrate-binding domain-containing protein [Pigmentiphaga litoralis]|uniref:DNA-binding transcriptional LysR family regulator n=1 Tax=Pigmentiphaga litoralis TaxID=516702 RepID=A0A7Y9IT97_9BURK|nr:LysR substrate-binding domain-containing protein [Pigmentiphaga litoralis]NYE23755.1 DNA-binding transcriptional LysR family regulator [Pigmentiphaga litoralis]NYE82631.1 DNA-binding transcriptional LysR family regulator [Pigmentiphaga litoralis]
MTQIDWYMQLNLKARHLRLITALYDHGNLKQVAEISHVTVPAVSKALAELEKGLGLELFSRTAQGLRPTAYGECLVRHARTLMTEIHQARDELKSLSSGAEGKVHVGAFPAATSVLLPQAIALLKQRSPRTNVLVTEGIAQTLLPELWQGRVDIVVGRLPVRNATDGFDEKELLDEPVSLMIRNQHPLARKKRLKWSDLQPYPWVLPPTGTILRAPLERTLEQHGVALPNNYVETLSTSLARAYLLVTDAIAVMAGAVAHDAAQPLKILPLTFPHVMRPRGVLWNKNRGLTPGAELMVQCLEEAATAMKLRPATPVSDQDT